MKHLNFLSNLLSLSLGSPCTDVSLDRRLTVGSPSGLDAKWKQNPFMRFAVVLTLIFTIGSGNVWGAYTYSGTGTFNKQSTIDGNGYYVIVLSSSGAMTGSASSNYVGVNTGYNGSASSISNPATSIVLQVTNYDGTNKKYYINNNSGNYLYSSGDKKIAYSATSQYWEIATVSKKERLKTAQATVVYMGYVANSGFRPYTNSTSNVQSVSAIYKLAATTPSVTPDPTSLSWGTVLQGSSQGNKTISITGANLAAGTLTISATGGYSVTPTSKSVSGTLAATNLTVTPPSTATTGAKDGKVTISGGGLASNVEVNLSMTVNAASTVTWMNNGSEYTTTLVANGSKPEFPDNPTSCDGTSTTFVGWTPTPWSGKLDDISAKTIYTSGAAMPNVGGAVTYHAVFAAQSDFTRVNSTSELATGKLLVIVDAYNSKTLNTDLSASTAPTETSGKITPSANMIWTLEANSTNWKLKTGSNYLKGDANPTSSSKTKTISLGTSGNLTWVIASNSYTDNGTPVFSIRNSSSANAGLEYSSGWKLYYTTNLNTSYYTEKLYISSYSKYLTTCCTQLGSINGSFFWTPLFEPLSLDYS